VPLDAPAQKGAAMYEFLGALAFATLVVGYVLALVCIRHEDDGFSRPGSIRRSETDSAGLGPHPSSLSKARAATRSSVAQPSMNQS
jgi:hypothetical protein